MGKRELVLITGFVLVGCIAYWFTAPPAEDQDNRLSLGRITRNVRAEVFGVRTRHPIRAHLREESTSGLGTLDLEGFRGTVVVAGHDGHEIRAELRGEVFGLDQREAAAVARDTALQLERDDDVARLAVLTPTWRYARGRPDLALTINLPTRMHLRLSEVEGKLDVRGVASVTLDDVSAGIRIVDVGGVVSGTIERSSADISRVGLVDLETGQGELIVSDVSGPVVLRPERGSVSLSRVQGPITVEARDVSIDIDANLGPLMVEARDGRLILRDAQAPVTIEAEDLEVRLFMARAVPVNIATTDRRLDITLPSSEGVLVDATSNGGELLVPNALRVEVSDETQRARGPIGGGGAPLVVTNRSGSIIIREIPKT
ncbi:MAG: hypothetical protein GEV06_27145 [Luteitalea sp.]|nr:hypothetical protein [Luteitalea sp.]